MKLRTLLLIFILVSIHFISLAQLNYGKVKEEKRYCKLKTSACKCDSSKFSSPDICNSKNEFEVRISFIDSNNVNYFYLLSYDSANKWSGIVILDSFIRMSDNWTLVKKSSRTYPLIPAISFDSIFNELKANKIFKLPGDIFDYGETIYSVAYKVGNKIRQYQFSAPGKFNNINHFNSRFLNIADRKRYFNIAGIFTSQFNFQQSL